MRLLAGTSGFAFKEWKGVFYPPDLADDAWLGYYASRFPTVEINNTFYRLPKEHVLREWAAQVPEQFTFAIKASMRITHYARLKPDAAVPLDFLLRNTAAMADRMGPILFQLPPNTLSRILEDDEGCHIVRVLERQEARRAPFNEVQAEIRQRLNDGGEKKRRADYIEKLRAKTPVWTVFDDEAQAQATSRGGATIVR